MADFTKFWPIKKKIPNRKKRVGRASKTWFSFFVAYKRTPFSLIWDAPPRYDKEKLKRERTITLRKTILSEKHITALMITQVVQNLPGGNRYSHFVVLE